MSMPDLETLLPELEPPEGGLPRLRQALAQPPRHAAPGWWLAGATACVCALVLAVMLPPRIAQARRTAMLSQALQAAPDPAGIRVRHGGAVEIPSGQADVRVYLLLSEASAAPASR